MTSSDYYYSLFLVKIVLLTYFGDVLTRSVPWSGVRHHKAQFSYPLGEGWPHSVYENPSVKDYSSSVQPTGTFYDKKRGILRSFPGGGIPLLVDYQKRCTDNYVGIKAHPTQNQYYYVCKPDCVVFGKCQNLQAFDASKGLCNSYPQPDYNTICKKPGRFPILTDCTIYYTCDARLKSQIFSCPRNTVFSPLHGKCIRDAKCRPTIVSPYGTHIPQDCVHKFPPCVHHGTFRTPSDCSLYYTCALQTNRIYLQTRYRCPELKFFDTELGVCRPQHEVACDAIQLSELVYPRSPALPNPPVVYPPNYSFNSLEENEYLNELSMSSSNEDSISASVDSIQNSSSQEITDNEIDDIVVKSKSNSPGLRQQTTEEPMPSHIISPTITVKPSVTSTQPPTIVATENPSHVIVEHDPRMHSSSQSAGHTKNVENSPNTLENIIDTNDFGTGRPQVESTDADRLPTKNQTKKDVIRKETEPNSISKHQEDNANNSIDFDDYNDVVHNTHNYYDDYMQFIEDSPLSQKPPGNDQSISTTVSSNLKDPTKMKELSSTNDKLTKKNFTSQQPTFSELDNQIEPNNVSSPNIVETNAFNSSKPFIPTEKTPQSFANENMAAMNEDSEEPLDLEENEIIPRDRFLKDNKNQLKAPNKVFDVNSGTEDALPNTLDTSLTSPTSSTIMDANTSESSENVLNKQNSTSKTLKMDESVMDTSDDQSSGLQPFDGASPEEQKTFTGLPNDRENTLMDGDFGDIKSDTATKDAENEVGNNETEDFEQNDEKVEASTESHKDLNPDSLTLITSSTSIPPDELTVANSIDASSEHINDNHISKDNALDEQTSQPEIEIVTKPIKNEMITTNTEPQNVDKMDEIKTAIDPSEDHHPNMDQINSMNFLKIPAPTTEALSTPNDNSVDMTEIPTGVVNDTTLREEPQVGQKEVTPNPNLSSTEIGTTQHSETKMANMNQTEPAQKERKGDTIINNAKPRHIDSKKKLESSAKSNRKDRIPCTCRPERNDEIENVLEESATEIPATIEPVDESDKLERSVSFISNKNTVSSSVSPAQFFDTTEGNSAVKDNIVDIQEQKTKTDIPTTPEEITTRKELFLQENAKEETKGLEEESVEVTTKESTEMFDMRSITENDIITELDTTIKTTEPSFRVATELNKSESFTEISDVENITPSDTETKRENPSPSNEQSSTQQLLEENTTAMLESSTKNVERDLKNKITNTVVDDSTESNIEQSQSRMTNTDNVIANPTNTQPINEALTQPNEVASASPKAAEIEDSTIMVIKRPSTLRPIRSAAIRHEFEEENEMSKFMGIEMEPLENNFKMGKPVKLYSNQLESTLRQFNGEMETRKTTNKIPTFATTEKVTLGSYNKIAINNVVVNQKLLASVGKFTDKKESSNKIEIVNKNKNVISDETKIPVDILEESTGLIRINIPPFNSSSLISNRRKGSIITDNINKTSDILTRDLPIKRKTSQTDPEFVSTMLHNTAAIIQTKNEINNNNQMKENQDITKTHAMQLNSQFHDSSSLDTKTNDLRIVPDTNTIQYPQSIKRVYRQNPVSYTYSQVETGDPMNTTDIPKMEVRVFGDLDLSVLFCPNDCKEMHKHKFGKHGDSHAVGVHWNPVKSNKTMSLVTV